MPSLSLQGACTSALFPIKQKLHELNYYSIFHIMLLSVDVPFFSKNLKIKNKCITIIISRKKNSFMFVSQAALNYFVACHT